MKRNVSFSMDIFSLGTRFTHQRGNLGKVALFPQCLVWIHHWPFYELSLGLASSRGSMFIRVNPWFNCGTAGFYKTVTTPARQYSFVSHRENSFHPRQFPDAFGLVLGAQRLRSYSDAVAFE